MLIEDIESLLDQKKCQDIVKVDLKEKTSAADSMIITTCESGRQLAFVAEFLRTTFKKEGFEIKQDGNAESDWIVLEIGGVLVHLFKPESRLKYKLEELWDTSKFVA